MGHEKYYAVWKGKIVGIFKYWMKDFTNPDCPAFPSSIEYAKNSVDGISNAGYQGFKTLDEAIEKLESELEKQAAKPPFKYHNQELKNDLPRPLW